MKLKMERTGKFTVIWKTDATTQCGQTGNNILDYKVVLETSDKHLDQHGFIIDNNRVHAYFVKKYGNVEKFVSCELIAAEACRTFRKHMPNLYSISVSISGNPNAAWLTAHWSRTEEEATPLPTPTYNIKKASSLQKTPGVI